MSKQIKYPVTSRNDNICNICQKSVDRLSYDHIPPKGWMIPRPVTIESYPEGSYDDVFRQSKSPNGLKFRTICSSCNNMLGARFDKALKKFTSDITSISESPLNVFRSFSLETQPALVVKAVLGHMLAAKVGYCQTTIDNEIRQYIMNDKTVLSNKIKLYYWYYPFDRAIISLDKMSYDMLTGSTAFFSTIKYYPIAFLMMYESQLRDHTIPELTKYIKKDETAKVRIPFSLNPMPASFPESSKYSECCLVPDDHTDIIAQ